jgi:tetratricopeptide (TPR) repeat protein
MIVAILGTALVVGPVVFADDDKNIKPAAVNSPAPAASAFAEQMKAAKETGAAGKFETARSHYTAALSVADTPELKAEAVFERNKLLLKNKQNAEAEKLLKEFLKDESLSPAVRRKTLHSLAGQIKWGQPDEAMQYLDQAEAIPAANIDDQAQAGITRGYIYKIKGQPDNALEVWLPLLELRNVHPANLSSISHDIGAIYRQKNDEENARKYFQLAVDYGKKVKYKFDYSASEKALEKNK